MAGIGASEEIERTEPERAPLPDPTGLAHTSSPVDLPEPPVPLPGGLKWASTIIAIASLFLLLLNAGALRGWAYELHPNETTAKVVALSESWYDATAQLGLNRPVESIHSFWRGVMRLRFPGQAAASADGAIE
jgi:hypothetical protein